MRRVVFFRTPTFVMVSQRFCSFQPNTANYRNDVSHRLAAKPVESQMTSLAQWNPQAEPAVCRLAFQADLEQGWIVGERIERESRCVGSFMNSSCAGLFPAFSPTFADQPDGAAVLYHEGFEEADPVTFWTNGGKGEYRVNFKGLTSERSASGKQSFKLDITFLKDGNFNYWAGPVIDIPAVPGMRVQAKLFVEQNDGVKVGLGTSYYAPAVTLENPKSTGRGMCQAEDMLGSKPRHIGRWITQEADLGIVGNSVSPTPGVRMEKWYFHIGCRGARDARLVVYLDDVSVEGTVSADWEESSDAALQAWDAERRAKHDEKMQAFETALAPLRAEAQALHASLPGDDVTKAVPEEPWGHFARTLLEQARAESEKLLKTTAPGRTKLPTVQIPVSNKPAEYLRDLRDGGIRPAQCAVENLARLAGRSDPFLVFVRDNPVTNYRVLPETQMIDGVIGDTIRLFAAPGEYEPATFFIVPSENTTLTFDISDLQHDSHVIPKGALDLRLVKVWYQAGIVVGETDKHLLTPELLLKDSALVEVDHAGKTNRVRNVDAPRDAKELQPVPVPSRSAQQFWLTVHVPEEAAPGEYSGTITVQAEGLGDRQLDVSLRVLPFVLAEPEQEYSLYYRAFLGATTPEIVSSEQKTEAQMEAEFRNMKAHGITNPNVYQRVNVKKDGSFDSKYRADVDFTHLDQVFDLREQVGMKLDPLYFLGVGTGSSTNEVEIARRIEIMRNVLEWAKGRGIRTVYFQGSDEARGEELRRQREIWEEVHAIGGKIFVATSTGFFDLVGDLLDLPVVARESPDDVSRVQALGHKIHYYSNPAGAIEKPYTFRYRFGHWLDATGMDGVQTYAYQHGIGPGKSMGRMWDDFDDPNVYRSIAFTYPTVDGVVDTLQWEGVREGVDDMRYLTTLRKAIDRAASHSDSAVKERANTHRAWLATADREGGLQELRRQIAERIVELQELMSGGTER